MEPDDPAPREESARLPDSLPLREQVQWDDHAQNEKRVPGEQYAHTTATATAPLLRRVGIPAALLDNDWNNHQPTQHHHARATAPPPALPGHPGYTNPWHTP